MRVDYSETLDVSEWLTDRILPPPNHRNIKYFDMVCAFDIETSNVICTRTAEGKYEEVQATMYVWQFCIDGKVTIIGRTWEQYRHLLHRLVLWAGKRAKIVVLVHNLSFEFQFLTGIYDFLPKEVMAVKSRRVLRCEMYGCVEYRDTYLHSNKSLAKYLSGLGVPAQKLSGFDYSKLRYWYTTLTDEELDYCEHDVLGLVQAYKEEMRRDGDTLYTIPSTSTGYVRRDVRAAMWGDVTAKRIYPTEEVYILLREAFRGGNTHANRYYAGDIITGVKSADRSSSYPEVLVNHLYPISPFYKYPGVATIDDVRRLSQLRKKALLMRVRIRDIKLRDSTWGCPYLSESRCRHVLDAVLDNGRILTSRMLETTVTDVDLDIICTEYDGELEILETWAANYGRLPDPLINCNLRYYKNKTNLKGVPGMEYEYGKSKALLNAIYGMMAQDPGKAEIEYDCMDDEGKWHTDESVSLAKLLDAARGHAFVAYQWGVWCTAWARYELELGIRIVHEHGDFVYCDTDSVKYLGKCDFGAYNSEKEELAKTTHASATDPTGERHTMGVYETDGEYRRFVTLGAKKYAYEDMSGKLHITLAGVPKTGGERELEEAGGLEAFKPGMIFRANKLMSVYNDNVHKFIRTQDGFTVEITPNVALVETEYHLGITEEYADILTNAQLWRDLDKLKYAKGLTT